MTTEEFSNEFDIMVSAFVLTNPLSFNEYEKSIFLTEAQEEIVLGYYKGIYNQGRGFEYDEETRRTLHSLLKSYSLKQSMIVKESRGKYDFYQWQLEEDPWYIVYDKVKLSEVDDNANILCSRDEPYLVMPVRRDELNTLLRNPFKCPSKNRIFRVEGAANRISIVVPNTLKVTSYSIEYISKPEPIVLAVLPEDLSIDGISTVNECKLSSSLHRRILELAVKKALESRQLFLAGNTKEEK